MSRMAIYTVKGIYREFDALPSKLVAKLASKHPYLDIAEYGDTVHEEEAFQG